MTETALDAGMGLKTAQAAEGKRRWRGMVDCVFMMILLCSYDPLFYNPPVVVDIAT